MKIKVSAPGKLMLFGEHAVVQGKPCIVTAVDQRLTLSVTKILERELQLNAPDVGIENYHKDLLELGNGEIPKGAKFIETAVKNLFASHPELITSHPELVSGSSGVQINTASQFKSTFGFGSSSATAICTIKAMSELFELNLTEKEIFDIAYQTVLDIQGVGSGFDLAAAIFGGTLYFATGGKIIEPLAVKELPLIVGYTGVKADTATLVKMVNAARDRQPLKYKNLFDEMGKITIKAKTALVEGDFKEIGALMNSNQDLLEQLGVSSEELDNLIGAARNAGAYGAKLSGAGGGDCMIALAPSPKRKDVEEAIEKAGGQVLKVKVNAEGVKVES